MEIKEGIPDMLTLDTFFFVFLLYEERFYIWNL